MKILIMCAVWERPEITWLFAKNMKHFIENSPHEVTLLAVVSKEDRYYNENINHLVDFEICHYKNSPVGEKMNGGIHYALDSFEFDYMMNIGSDDIIFQGIWKVYEPYLKSNYKFFGMASSYIMDYATKNIVRFDYDGDFTSLGAGRMIHRSILEQIRKKGMNVYSNETQRGLDTCSALNIMKYLQIPCKVIFNECEILDIKTINNLNTFEEMEIICSKVTNQKEILAKLLT